nr:uncharacterized protein KIAA0040 homolog isoform X2 [Loxodonta africana]
MQGVSQREGREHRGRLSRRERQTRAGVRADSPGEITRQPRLEEALREQKGVISGMSKPKVRRGISYKWSRLCPLEPRTCW